ncbi:MAG TPA: hypothetical protein VF149_07250 [Bacillales bacterium]
MPLFHTYQGWLAYTSNRGGLYDIWLFNPQNGEDRQLTNGLGESFSVPVWSPDSRKIAFVGQNNILYVVRLSDDSVARIDQFGEGLGVHLSWSPDSEKITYTKNGEIVLYNILNHHVKRLNQPGATDVQWFPGGTGLLFQAPDSTGTSQLFRIQPNGTNKKQITHNTEGPLHDVLLSPDGAFALYTTPGASISLIRTVDISTGDVYEVSGGPLAKNYFPVWSPDSSKIAYSATAYGDRGYYSLIRTSGKKGENDRTLTLSDCYATPVTWSPNGRKIGYLSGCYGQGVASELWLIDVNSPFPIRVLAGVQIASLQWSPKPIAVDRKTYTNKIYKVQFQYPAQWQKVNDERYEGPNGFFQISAVSGNSIDEVCRNEAFHQLMPYGTNPKIITTVIQNQRACFIFPSVDQPPEMNGQAALIVQYPKPIQIQGTSYNFFILWADQWHIKELSSTLTFLT